jgi:hypothetical protein
MAQEESNGKLLQIGPNCVNFHNSLTHKVSHMDYLIIAKHTKLSQLGTNQNYIIKSPQFHFSYLFIQWNPESTVTMIHQIWPIFPIQNFSINLLKFH